MTQKKTNVIQSVDRALGILDVLSKSKNALGVTEIASIMGLHKSTTFGLLTTLEKRNMVKQISETGKYALGLRLFELGNIVYERMDLRNIVKPYLESLSQEFEETVHFAIEDEGMVVYIEKIESSRAVVGKSSIGKRNPLYCTGVGKCILAFMPEDEFVSKLPVQLQSYTKNTITSLEDLKRELAKIRENGFGIDNEEIEIGLRCVAAPVKDHTGKVIGAISISGPSMRLTDERIDQIKGSLIQATTRISNNLGYA